jgi:hypothetical protein
MSMENWLNDTDGENRSTVLGEADPWQVQWPLCLKTELHCRLPLYLGQASYLNCKYAQISTQWARGLRFGSRQGLFLETPPPMGPNEYRRYIWYRGYEWVELYLQYYVFISWCLINRRDQVSYILTFLCQMLQLHLPAFNSMVVGSLQISWR